LRHRQVGPTCQVLPLPRVQARLLTESDTGRVNPRDLLAPHAENPLNSSRSLANSLIPTLAQSAALVATAATFGSRRRVNLAHRRDLGSLLHLGHQQPRAEHCDVVTKLLSYSFHSLSHSMSR
jgi:hypothetical protein